MIDKVIPALISALSAGPAPHQSMMEGLIPIAMIVVIFYLVIFRPQSKKMKAHKEFLASLQKDDEVVTDGGIMGRITNLTDTVVTLEVSDNIRIRIMRPNIAGPRPKDMSAPK